MTSPATVKSIAIPPGTAIHAAMPGAQFFDAYEVADPHPARTALQTWLDVVARTPRWTQQLMALRNRLVRLVGLKDLGRTRAAAPGGAATGGPRPKPPLKVEIEARLSSEWPGAFSPADGGSMISVSIDGQRVAERPVITDNGLGQRERFTITDPRSLWVQIDAREIDTGILKPGAGFELEVAAYPGTLFQGKVLAASDFIDPSTRTIKVRGLVANADRRLKAEMLATARVHQTFSSGVVVPAAAITLNGTHHAVFVQTQPGVFEPRDVTLVHQGPKEVVVSKGLQAGELVVSDNALLLARQFHVAQEDSIGRSESPKSAPATEGKESTGKGNAP